MYYTRRLSKDSGFPNRFQWEVDEKYIFFNSRNYLSLKLRSFWSCENGPFKNGFFYQTIPNDKMDSCGFDIESIWLEPMFPKLYESQWN